MKYGILTFDEPKPDTSRKILHVDMDAFYASIEVRDQPHLKDSPVIIAKHPRLTGGRGIVTTCNYEARKYGVHSAMSSTEALKLCPHAVFIPGRKDYYEKISKEIHQIFRQFTDIYEPIALDEAYLDVTHNKYQVPSGTIVAHMIQEKIKKELDLTCSIGVSYNKFIAKLASDFKKPSGITVIEPHQAADFLSQLPIKDFQGVGKKTLPQFYELGIHTGADLLKLELTDLIHHFGKLGYSLYFNVRGIQNTPVRANRPRKSIGNETTLTQETSDEARILSIFERLSHKVAKRMTNKRLIGQTVSIKIRYENFETITRQTKLDTPINDEIELFEIVSQLWNIHGEANKQVRLIGVSVSDFVDTSIQEMSLLDEL